MITEGLKLPIYMKTEESEILDVANASYDEDETLGIRYTEFYSISAIAPFEKTNGALGSIIYSNGMAFVCKFSPEVVKMKMKQNLLSYEFN